MLLNRGESVHHLQRAIYYGKVSHECGRRRDEMKVISGSHALLTNIVLAWNTAQCRAWSTGCVRKARSSKIADCVAWARAISATSISGALSAFLWSATRTRSYNDPGRRRGGLRETEGTRSPCAQVAGRAKVESAADFQISSSDVRRLS